MFDPVTNDARIEVATNVVYIWSPSRTSQFAMEARRLLRQCDFTMSVLYAAIACIIHPSRVLGGPKGWARPMAADHILLGGGELASSWLLQPK